MWWWPYRQFCIVSERPSEVHTADGPHLHNDAGPAVRFRDGWCVWAIDGWWSMSKSFFIRRPKASGRSGESRILRSSGFALSDTDGIAT